MDVVLTLQDSWHRTYTHEYARAILSTTIDVAEYACEQEAMAALYSVLSSNEVASRGYYLSGCPQYSKYLRGSYLEDYDNFMRMGKKALEDLAISLSRGEIVRPRTVHKYEMTVKSLCEIESQYNPESVARKILNKLPLAIYSDIKTEDIVHLALIAADRAL